jgi:superfamily II DNA/RNA helicase
MLVVDEADQMISQDGFQEETINLKRYFDDPLGTQRLIVCNAAIVR